MPMGRPGALCSPAFVSGVRCLWALQLEVQTPGRLGARILQSSPAVLAPVLFFFLFFSPDIAAAPVQGGTAHLPEPKKSSSMARL